MRVGDVKEDCHLWTGNLGLRDGGFARLGGGVKSGLRNDENCSSRVTRLVIVADVYSSYSCKYGPAEIAAASNKSRRRRGLLMQKGLGFVY